MKYAYLVTGPNASGKTTALQRATEAYARDPRLRVVYADNSDRKAFKGDAPQMVRLLEEIWMGPEDIVIVEGTRMPTIMERAYRAHPDERIVGAFVTWTEAHVMEAHIRGRCTLLGKRFRDDYWDVKKLTYEGQRRYRMSVPRFVPADRITWWNIDPSYVEGVRMSEAILAAVQSILGDPQPVAPIPTLTPEPVGEWKLF